MPERVKIEGSVAQTAEGRKTYTVAGRTVAVFNVHGELYAVDDRCPHRGGPLSEGTLDGTVVRCPLHGWRFDLSTGRCLDVPGESLACFDVSRDGDGLLLDLTQVDATVSGDGIYRYLVRYGALGWVGRFGSIERIECTNGDRVVVQTRRGLEIGEVLLFEANQPPGVPAPLPTGEVLRRMTPDDAGATGRIEVDSERFDECVRAVVESGAAIEVVDCEWLFDGKTVVLYYLGDAHAGVDLAEKALEKIFGARVLFHPLAEGAAEPSDPGGCGQGGCGSGGCSAHAS